MQHKRSRLSTKILAFVLILALVFPASAFASVADVAKDTRAPGKSLANTYPAYTDIDWQISLAEDATATVTLPTNLTENELAAAMDAGLSLSLDRDTQRGYLNPEKFPNPYQGGPLDSWKTQRDTQMFQVDDYGFAFDDDGKVSLVLYLNISCYFANRSGSVDYSAPHSNGGAYLDLCGYYTLRVTADGKDIASCHAKVVPYDSFRTVYELYDDLEALAAMDTDLYVSKESMGQTTTDGYDMPYLIVADSKESVDKWLAYTDLVESDPDLALTKLANGDFDDLRVPMFASNVHSNENAAVNGILEFAHLLLENETDPVIWRGPIIADVVKQFWTDVCWGEVDYMFVDLPPGTGDVMLTVFQSLPIDGVVIVTSPQSLVSMIVSKAVNMARMMNIPVYGFVENYSYFQCPDCGKRVEIFGKSKLDELALQFSLPVLARLPIDPAVAASFDAGRMAQVNTDPVMPAAELMAKA